MVGAVVSAMLRDDVDVDEVVVVVDVINATRVLCEENDDDPRIDEEPPLEAVDGKTHAAMGATFADAAKNSETTNGCRRTIILRLMRVIEMNEEGSLGFFV